MMRATSPSIDSTGKSRIGSLVFMGALYHNGDSHDKRYQFHGTSYNRFYLSETHELYCMVMVVGSFSAMDQRNYRCNYIRSCIVGQNLTLASLAAWRVDVGAMVVTGAPKGGI